MCYTNISTVVLGLLFEYSGPCQVLFLPYLSFDALQDALGGHFGTWLYINGQKPWAITTSPCVSAWCHHSSKSSPLSFAVITIIDMLLGIMWSPVWIPSQMLINLLSGKFLLTSSACLEISWHDRCSRPLRQMRDDWMWRGSYWGLWPQVWRVKGCLTEDRVLSVCLVSTCIDLYVEPFW